MFSIKRTRNEWIAKRDEKWRNLGSTIRRCIRAGLPVDMRDQPPGVVSDYRVWLQACSEIPPSTATVQTQRVTLCRRRKLVLDRLPLHLRDVPHAHLPLEFDYQREQLEDIEWRLASLRKGHNTDPNAQPLQDDWTYCNDRLALGRRLKKYQRYLRAAGGAYAGTPRATELAAICERVEARKRTLELEDYEQRLQEWREDRAAGAPHAQSPKSTPKRPWWFAQEEKEAAIQERRERRMHKPLQPLAPDPHLVRLERDRIDSDRKASLHAERKRATLESHVVALLDWAWGEGRRMHIGEEIDGWLYIDDAHGVPRSTTPSRAAALAACAVRLSTGWAFPPATARGRS